MLNLHVVFASTRPGRVGLPVANWITELSKKHGGFAVTLVDLQAVNLPLFDESRHPRLQQYEHEHTKRWSAIVSAADAFVFVTPEYNYSAPPALINAFDFLYKEWSYKPCAFVSYGGASGGLRGVQVAKQTASALKMAPLADGVSLPMFTGHLKDGVFSPPEASEKSAGVMLDELARWASALKPMRG